MPGHGSRNRSGPDGRCAGSERRGAGAAEGPTGGWRGSAADSFRECWDAWLLGAHDVIEGLDAMSSLLVATRLEYQRQDDDAHSRFDLHSFDQGRLDSIAGLIVERLG